MSYTDRALARQETDFVPPLAGAEDRPTTDDGFVVETRFGTIEVDPRSIVRFKSGLLGFSDARQFVLIDLDNPKYVQFRVLQCVDDTTLSFVVFPPNLDNGLIEHADIAAAAKTIGYPVDQLIVLLLVTLRRTKEAGSLSVNLRAPVLIDTSRFAGVQYVLPDDKYPVRFAL